MDIQEAKELEVARETLLMGRSSASRVVRNLRQHITDATDLQNCKVLLQSDNTEKSRVVNRLRRMCHEASG
jgi:hypothetical protein